MKLTKKQKEIIRQDIIDLGNLLDMYTKEGKFHKASECLAEMEQLKRKLRGKENE